MQFMSTRHPPSCTHSPAVTLATTTTGTDYMNEGVTNNEVTMEFNSAYQSVEVAEAESETVEFTPSNLSLYLAAIYNSVHPLSAVLYIIVVVKMCLCELISKACRSMLKRGVPKNSETMHMHASGE